jgi:hypothetical protein
MVTGNQKLVEMGMMGRPNDLAFSCRERATLDLRKKQRSRARSGRPCLEQEEGVLIGQVIKQYTKRHVRGVTRRIVQGAPAAIAAVLAAPHTGTEINTASSERLNATFRRALASPVRRGRAIAPTDPAQRRDVTGSAKRCATKKALRVCRGGVQAAIATQGVLMQ